MLGIAVLKALRQALSDNQLSAFGVWEANLSKGPGLSAWRIDLVVRSSLLGTDRGCMRGQPNDRGAVAHGSKLQVGCTHVGPVLPLPRTRPAPALTPCALGRFPFLPHRSVWRAATAACSTS